MPAHIKGPASAASRESAIWGERFNGRDHVLSVATVVVDASDFKVHAVAEIAAAAGEAGVVLPAVPPYADALTLFPGSNTGTELGDYAGNFVAGRARVGQAWPKPVLDQDVAEANTAGLHADADLAWAGLGNFAFLDFEIRAGFGNNGDFHFWHWQVSLV